MAYKTGDLVIHPVFGVGTVVSVGDAVDVKFDRLATIRSIRRDFAGLRRA